MDIATKVALGLASRPEMESLGEDKVFKIKADRNVEHRSFVTRKAEDSQDGRKRIVLSEESPDRIEDVVKLDGLDMTDFDKNPVMFFGHDKFSAEGLIGSWEVPLTREGRQLVGTPVFMDAGINPQADMVSEMLNAGFLKGASISFIPEKTRKATSEEQKELGISSFSVVHEKSSLLEVSLVSLPMHPSALAKAILDIEQERGYLEEVHRKFLEDWPVEPISKQLEAIMSELLELRAAVLDKPQGKSVSTSEAVESPRTDSSLFYRDLFASALSARKVS